MADQEDKLGGNISLINFGVLEPAELIVVKKIVGTYVKKLSERANYKSLKLRLKQSEHGKSFLHEIDAEAIIVASQSEDGKNIVLSSSANDRSLFSALSEVLEKIISQTEHTSRSTKQVGGEMKRRQVKRLEE
ncbi:hypothetical protein HZA33_01675 [Candidatus Pacearchaeota archaeon]|nr:hypothetical protein [Candidatus Pacearchaeota archaeon]